MALLTELLEWWMHLEKAIGLEKAQKPQSGI